MKPCMLAAAVLLMLAGCKAEPKKDAGAGTAQGEVLPGSASDAMLPLDTVKSQAPLAPVSEGANPAADKPDKSVKLGAKGQPDGSNAPSN